MLFGSTIRAIAKNGWYEELIPVLEALRTIIRFEEFSTEFPNWNTGACGIVSECLEVELGWPQACGCYINREGKRIKDHLWNILPDGRIIDTTHDQFGEGDSVLITQSDDSRYFPCLGECEC